jgi:hypothetical protein
MALFAQQQTQIQTPHTVSLIEQEYDTYETPQAQSPQTPTATYIPRYVPIYVNKNDNMPIIAVVSIVGLLGLFALLAFLKR